MLSPVTAAKRIIGSSFALVVAAGVLVGTVYVGLLPEKKILTPERRAAMRRAVEKILETTPRPTERIVRLSVAPLAGDVTDEVTGQIRRLLDAEGFYNVAPSPVGDRAREKLKLERREVEEERAGIELGKKDGSELVMWGRVHRLSQTGGTAAVDLELHLTEVQGARARKWDNRVKIGAGSPEEPTVPGEDEGFSDKAGKAAGRLLLCLVGFVALSLLGRPPIAAALDRRSNAVNFALLLSLTALDAVLVLILLRGCFSMFLYVAITLVLTIAAGWYNFWFCTKLDETL